MLTLSLLAAVTWPYSLQSIFTTQLQFLKVCIHWDFRQWRLSECHPWVIKSYQLSLLWCTAYRNYSNTWNMKVGAYAYLLRAFQLLAEKIKLVCRPWEDEDDDSMCFHFTVLIWARLNGKGVWWGTKRDEMKQLQSHPTPVKQPPLGRVAQSGQQWEIWTLWGGR